MTEYDKLEELKNLNNLQDELNQHAKVIQEITKENININKLKVPLEIYKNNPKVFSDAYNLLNESEKASLISLGKLSSTPETSPLINTINNILSNKPVDTVPDLESGIIDIFNKNNSQLETTQKSYDDLNIKIKELLKINPLDLIDFGSDSPVKRLFSLNANSMLKLINKFMITSLKETTRPKIRTRKGQIDFSRTIRASMQYEGTPYELKRKSKVVRMRQVQPKIYFILDTSGSQSHAIYLSVALIYGIISVLKEYDVIIYTGSPHYHGKNTHLLLEEAERKNLTEQRIVDTTVRFNKQTILKYLNNPNKLFTLLTYISSGNSDDLYFILKSIFPIIPDNSLIITIGDEHALTLEPDYNRNFNKTIPQKNIKLMKQKLKGKVFSFNTTEYWDKDTISNTGKSEFNFVPFSSSNFNVENITFYPQINKSGFTYGDWVRELIKVISGFHEKNL